jgi:hypothetical protein
VSEWQEDDRDHRRAAQDVHPEVDLHAEVAEPDIELPLPDDERNDGDQPDDAGQKRRVSPTTSTP